MKAKYLERLRKKLEEFQTYPSEINEIIKDYDQLYDDALASGRTHEEVYQSLGEPEHVAYELIDTIRIKQKKYKRNKIIALMPFISVMVFMGVGLSTDIWHPTWMVFLLIPVVSIVLTTRIRDMIVALMPFASVVVFILLGEFYDLWVPGWLVFLSIPVVAILLHDRTVKGMANLIAIGLAIGFYLYYGYTYNDWTIGALGFILPVVVAIITGNITLYTNWPKKGRERNKLIVMLSVVIGSVAVFLTLGLLFEGWAYAWMVFLLIPVTAILFFSRPFRFTPLMPFIATVLFFSLGFFFGLWTISWMAFLLIPVVAVIENA